MASVPYSTADYLQSDAAIRAYLAAALDEGDPAVLALALREVAKARGGLAKVAQETGLSRESLYRALSPKGNPTVKTLTAVLRSVGLKLEVRPVE
ncbi:MAG: putative addiction module antidote protein [Candidatus Competibacteraceae bacterium]